MMHGHTNINVYCFVSVGMLVVGAVVISGQYYIVGIYFTPENDFE